MGGDPAALTLDPAASQVAASEEADGASPEEQRLLRSAALAVPPLAWQQLTPQLFSLLAQGQVGTTLAPSRRLLAVQRSM